MVNEFIQFLLILLALIGFGLLLFSEYKLSIVMLFAGVTILLAVMVVGAYLSYGASIPPISNNFWQV